MSLSRFLLLALLALALGAGAQEWPTKVVKFVSPYPPGGSVDPLARLPMPYLLRAADKIDGV